VAYRGVDLYSFRALWRHYRQCRRNKRSTANALAFEINAEANLLTLQQELRTRTYRPGRSICFITDGPKPREVFAADFRDRIEAAPRDASPRWLCVHSGFSGVLVRSVRFTCDPTAGDGG
jgi:hypothetical protein